MMSDDYITISELLALLGIFVAPLVCIGAVAQFRLLRRAHVRPRVAAVVVTIGAALAIPLTFKLLGVVPAASSIVFNVGFTGLLASSALLTVLLVTLVVAICAWLQARRPAA
jgi:hypothetical protein